MTNTLRGKKKLTSTGKVLKTTLYIPKDPLRYEATKVQQLLHILDSVALTAPEKLNIKDYLLTLEKYKQLCEEINKRAKGKKAQARVDKEAVVTGGDAISENPLG